MSRPSEDAALRQAAASATAGEADVDVDELLAYAAGRLDAAAAEALEARLVHDDEARALLTELSAAGEGAASVEAGAASARPAAPAASARPAAPAVSVDWAAPAAGAAPARPPTETRPARRWRRAVPFAAALTAVAATALFFVRTPAPPDYQRPRISGVIAADRCGSDADGASLAFAPEGTLVMVMDPVAPLDGDALRAAVFFVDGATLARADARVELGATGTVRVRLSMSALPRRAGPIRLDVAVARAPLDALAGLAPAEARARVAASWTTFDVHIEAQEPPP